MLQGSTSLSIPNREQFFPPFCGLGFVQLRSLCRIPPAHETLHADQTDHSVYPPFTGVAEQNVKRKKRIIKTHKQTGVISNS